MDLISSIINALNVIPLAKFAITQLKAANNVFQVTFLTLPHFFAKVALEIA